MNTPILELCYRQVARVFTATGVAGVIWSLSLLGSATYGSAAERPNAARELSQRRAAALAQAGEHLARGDIAAAEAELVRNNRAELGTASWHLETSRHLTDLALCVAREGQRELAKILAERALQHLGLADRLAKEPRQRTSALHAAGFLYERFLGDPQSALAAHRAAAEANPADAAAREKVERLQAREQVAQREVKAIPTNSR